MKVKLDENNELEFDWWAMPCVKLSAQKQLENIEFQRFLDECAYEKADERYD